MICLNIRECDCLLCCWKSHVFKFRCWNWRCFLSLVSLFISCVFGNLFLGLGILKLRTLIRLFVFVGGGSSRHVLISNRLNLSRFDVVEVFWCFDVCWCCWSFPSFLVVEVLPILIPYLGHDHQLADPTNPAASKPNEKPESPQTLQTPNPEFPVCSSFWLEIWAFSA